MAIQCHSSVYTASILGLTIQEDHQVLLAHPIFSTDKNIVTVGQLQCTLKNAYYMVLACLIAYLGEG